MKPMKPIRKSALLLLLALGQASIANAEYTETMNPNGLTSNLKDYGLVDDNGKTD